MINEAQCPHISRSIRTVAAPVPCEICRGFVDVDGSLLDAATARQRYPQHARFIDPVDREWHPTRGDHLLAVNRVVGALARSLLAIVFACIALTVVILVMVQALR